MSTSNALQDILKASKAGIDSLKAVQKKVTEDIEAEGKKQALFVSDIALKAARLEMNGVNSSGASTLKLISDAEARAAKNIFESQQKAVDLINQGLTEIETMHNESIAKINAKTDVDIAAIRAVVEDAIAAIRVASEVEEKHLMTFAQEFELALNLKERKGEATQ